MFLIQHLIITVGVKNIDKHINKQTLPSIYACCSELQSLSFLNVVHKYIVVTGDVNAHGIVCSAVGRCEMDTS